MLASAFPHLPQLQPPQFPFPPKPLHSPPPSKQKKKHRKTLKNPCLSCQISSVYSQIENPIQTFAFTEDPDAKSSSSSCSSSIQQSLHPNVLADMLESCSGVKEARRIHSVIVKEFGSSGIFVNNNLISVYVKLGQVTYARRVFDKMSQRDVVSWTAMLNGYLKAGLDDEFRMLFVEMVGNCVRVNAFTCVCVLKMCGRSLDFELGEQIHACILKGRWNNLIVDNALASFYAQCGDLSSALNVFERTPKRDVVSWTSVITAWARHGHGEEALSMFSQMQIDGFSPNEFTICSTLKACGDEKALKFGRQLHCCIIKKMFNSDVFVGSSLVHMYVKCGQVSDARILFDKMLRRNTVTWTSMIAGYAQNGYGEEAIKLFQRMKRRRIFANSLTVVSIISACGLVGSLDMGKEVHAQILKNSIEKNMYIGSTLVWLYCKCGEYVYATNVLENMPMRDVVSWTAIISGHARHGHGSEALEFLNDMLLDGVDPNPYTYSSALKACAKQEAVNPGKWIHAFVNKTRAISNVYVGSSLIDMYFKCGYFEDAFRVFDQMPERNLVSWKVMIVGYARTGHCQEALKLMYRMQVEGIKVDDFILAAVLNACGDVELETECPSACCLQSR
ncbi:hypothetical protein AAC387_Pa01g0127 [Persea americana]|eukprot:TRINITY_DN34033_c1_g1_i1.p1 TRINITY_DN34033_c1_g1~~TRINITY_DN34033_c1_g1_i1.p1  ORF type:complete len:618 (+),score=113.00 TRINITY_DN34033_c1_g1_i1:113-1966(+)